MMSGMSLHWVRYPELLRAQGEALLQWLESTRSGGAEVISLETIEKPVLKTSTTSCRTIYAMYYPAVLDHPQGRTAPVEVLWSRLAFPSQAMPVFDDRRTAHIGETDRTSHLFQ